MAGVSKGPVEEFTVGGGDETWGQAAEGNDARPTPRPWRGPTAWVSCAVVLVLIGVVLVRPLNLGTEPWGEVPDVTSVPRQAWTMQSEEELHLALLADGVLVTAGTQTVQGLDPGTGEQLWEQAMVSARCTTDSENLVCTDTASQVLQIDPHSGAASALDVPNAIVATVVGGDVFALTRAGQGQVQRISGGEVLWSTPVTVADDYGLSTAGLTVIAGRVLTTMVLDPADFSATGAVFDASTGDPWDRRQDFVVQLSTGVWLANHGDGGTVFVRGADEPSETVGAGGFLQYDDQWRGAEQVATTERGELGTMDRETGDWIWHTDYPAYPMVRAGGVVLAVIAGGEVNAIQGLRASTGELLWERSNMWVMCPCLSDGSTLAAQSFEVATDGSTSSEEAGIIGLDISSGEQLWRLPQPSLLLSTLTDGHHLVLASAWEVSGWQLG